jgi:alpha-1,3-rhamnosyl/mannosyltransferase
VRVVLNELQSLKQRAGIGRYTAELLCALRTLAPDEVAGFPAGLLATAARWSLGADRRLIAGAAAPGLVDRLRRHAVVQFRGELQKLLEWRFRRVCAAERYDLYHEPNFLPMPADCPTVATFHDLSPLRDSSWHPAERVARFERLAPAALARCAHLITDTEAVRRELIRDLGVPPGRVTSVHIGIRSDLRPLPPDELSAGLRRMGLPERYLLSVGTIEPRKNILRLLQAYCRLPARLRSGWPLVLAGGWGWNADEVANYLDTTARPRGVIHLGYVEDADLPVLYGGARALFFPSHYEGFGLPPLEMMACGGAVIASTADSVREVAGRQAYLLDPEDDDGWTRALARAVEDDDWRQSLRQGAREWAGQFTWERCAARTRAVYRMVASVGRDHRAAG